MSARKTTKEDMADLKSTGKRLRARRHDKIRTDTSGTQHAEYCSVGRQNTGRLFPRNDGMESESPSLFYRHEVDYQLKDKSTCNAYCSMSEKTQKSQLSGSGHGGSRGHSSEELNNSNDATEAFFAQRTVMTNDQPISFKEKKEHNYNKAGESSTSLKKTDSMLMTATHDPNFRHNEDMMKLFDRSIKCGNLNTNSFNHHSTEKRNEVSETNCGNLVADGRYQLEKLSLNNPDAIADIFLGLKNAYQGLKTLEDSNDLTFGSVSQLTTWVNEERSGLETKVYLPNRHNQSYLDLSLKAMQSRFD
jgi:hypothetical protein